MLVCQGFDNNPRIPTFPTVLRILPYSLWEKLMMLWGCNDAFEILWHFFPCTFSVCNPFLTLFNGSSSLNIFIDDKYSSQSSTNIFQKEKKHVEKILPIYSSKRIHRIRFISTWLNQKLDQKDIRTSDTPPQSITVEILSSFLLNGTTCKSSRL